MTRPSAIAGLLVLDPAVARHAFYREALAGLADRIEFLTPSDDIATALGDSQQFAAVLIQLDGIDGSRLRQMGDMLGALAGTPVVFFSADAERVEAITDGLAAPFDYLPWPVPPGLLRAKASLFLERARLHGELARLSGSVAALGSDLDRLQAAAAEEVRRADRLGSLASEHVHRGKNLLAIMQSISLRTLSEGRPMDEARGALIGRLRAISRAYQMLTAGDGSGAGIGEIMDGELHEVIHRVTTSGPPVRLRGSVVQTFTLAVHELATNAMQHGALSGQSGTVNVGWTLFETGAERYLEFEWSEQGGTVPAVTPRRGFGLSLISSLAGPGAASPNISFDGEGFSCRLRFPQEMIVSE